MGRYIVNLTEAEEKALSTDMISIQQWLDIVIHNKARRCIDKIIAEVTDRQVNKIPPEEKISIIRDVKVKTAAERQAELDKRLGISNNNKDIII